MSVLIVQPAFTQDVTKTKLRSSECLALGYLTSGLRAAGIAADPLDAHLKGVSNEQIVELVARSGYSIVGISCSAQRAYNDAVALATLLKQNLPDVHITLGGQFVSAVHERIARTTDVFDTIVRGEGDHVFPALVQQIEGGGDLTQIPSLTFRRGDEVMVTPLAPRVADLNAIPFPDRSYIHDVRDEVLAGVRYVSLIASRGCIYKCTFCSVDRPRMERSPENIVAELREIHETWGAWRFMFNDDLLIGATPQMQRWSEELADRLASELPGLELWGMTRADAVQPALFQKLYKAGFKKIFIGIESGSDNVLRRFQKGTRAYMNQQSIDVLKQIGIQPDYGYIMLEPQMSWSDLRENLDFVRQAGYFTRHNLTNRLSIYQGAPLYHSWLDQGQITPTDDVTERYLYTFDDPQVQLFNDVLLVLKRESFEVKRRITDLLVSIRELRVDLCQRIGVQTREWPSVKALAEAGVQLERREADTWLQIVEELYGRIDGGESRAALMEQMPVRALDLLAELDGAIEDLENQVADLAANPVPGYAPMTIP